MNQEAAGVLRLPPLIRTRKSKPQKYAAKSFTGTIRSICQTLFFNPIRLAMYRTISLLIIFALTFPVHAAAQDSSANTIQIHASGSASIKADLINLQVNINHFHSDSKTAYDRHREQEAFLTELLVDRDIEDKNITASPVSISPTQRGNNERGYQTRQQVTIKLDDPARYEEMQILLIENGFTSFSGSFDAADKTEAREQALKNAVEEARSKAELLAAATGKRVIDVKEIRYTGSHAPYAGEVQQYRAMAMDSSSSLLQFEQFITITENVMILFHIDSI